jgi:hypothetical protein
MGLKWIYFSDKTPPIRTSKGPYFFTKSPDQQLPNQPLAGGYSPNRAAIMPSVMLKRASIFTANTLYLLLQKVLISAQNNPN